MSLWKDYSTELAVDVEELGSAHGHSFPHQQSLSVSVSIGYYILVVINFNVYVLINVVGCKKLYFLYLSPKVGESLVALKPLYTAENLKKFINP